MNVADRARYKQLKAERKELQARINAIDKAVRRVDRFVGTACTGLDHCTGCPMVGICEVTDKAAEKAFMLRQRLSAVHDELNQIFKRKEGM